MNTKPKSPLRLILVAAILFTSLVSTSGIGYAQAGNTELPISVTPVILQCGDVEYTIDWTNGSPPYLFEMDYGDGIKSEKLELDINNKITLPHTYIVHGDYEWTVRVFETVEEELVLVGTTADIITLDGPAVTLSSNPFPPLFVVGDAGTVEFSTDVTGGTLDYTYKWDLDGDGTFDGETGDGTASFAYTEVGKYYPQVIVLDGCGFTASDTMPVVVANPGDACHPMAQKISDGVNSIFPAFSEDLYTCEDIYRIFDNESEENNLGFGRMWKAYHLAESMEILTWEDVLDWHLNQSGWGSLLQLDRFADLLEDHDLVELMGLVMSEEYTLGDVRTAVRSTIHYEAADFEDALSRIAEGATAGELGRLYKLAADLEVLPSAIDDYLEGGLTLAELKHMANYADRMEVDLTEILNIGIQDYRENLRMADKEEKNQQTADKFAEQYPDYPGDVMNLLNGECEGNWGCVRKALREQEQEMLQAEGPSEKDIQTAKKLAEQFSTDLEVVMDLFDEGECKGNWGCVRKALREQEQTMTQADGELLERDTQTALQISTKYGPTPEEVIEHYNIDCSGDWACTRAYYRDLYMSTKETGKPDK